MQEVLLAVSVMEWAIGTEKEEDDTREGVVVHEEGPWIQPGNYLKDDCDDDVLMTPDFFSLRFG